MTEKTPELIEREHCERVAAELAERNHRNGHSPDWGNAQLIERERADARATDVPRLPIYLICVVGMSGPDGWPKWLDSNAAIGEGSVTCKDFAVEGDSIEDAIATFRTRIRGGTIESVKLTTATLIRKKPRP